MEYVKLILDNDARMRYNGYTLKQRGYKMRNLNIEDNTLKCDVYAGSDITVTLDDAKKIAKLLNTTIEFKFNGVILQITENSNLDEEYNIWNKKIREGVGF